MSEHDENQQNEEEARGISREPEDPTIEIRPKVRTSLSVVPAGLHAVDTTDTTVAHSPNPLPSRPSMEQLKNGARQLKSAVARRSPGPHNFAGRRLRINRILMRQRHL